MTEVDAIVKKEWKEHVINSKCKRIIKGYK
jgi:hypothetical protein